MVAATPSRTELVGKMHQSTRPPSVYPLRSPKTGFLLAAIALLLLISLTAMASSSVGPGRFLAFALFLPLMASSSLLSGAVIIEVTRGTMKAAFREGLAHRGPEIARPSCHDDDFAFHRSTPPAQRGQTT